MSTASLRPGSTKPLSSGATTMRPPGLRQVGAARLVELEVDADVAQQRGQPGTRAGAVGRHDEAVALAEQPAQTLADRGAVAVAATPRPPTRAGRHGRRVGRLGHVDQRPAPPSRPARAGGRVEVQPGEGLAQTGAPGDGQRAGQVVLLGDHVGGPVAEPLRLHQDDQGVGGAAGR